MLQLPKNFSATAKALLAAGLVLLVLAGVWLVRKLTYREPLKIGVIVSRTELSEEEWETVQFMVGKRLEEVNQKGGIRRRPLQALYLDDHGDTTRLLSMVQEAAKDKNLIALIGAQGVARARSLGPLVTQEQLPYIGYFVYTQYTQQFPTIFTANLGYNEGYRLFERLMVSKATEIGFIGRQQDRQAEAFLNGVKLLVDRHAGLSLTYQHFFPEDHNLTSQEMVQLADSIRNSRTDFLIFASRQQNIYQVLEALVKHGVEIPVFCGQLDIAQLRTDDPYVRAVELYDFNSFGIPGTHNSLLYEELLLRRKNLQKLPENNYLLGLSGSIADVAGLIAEAAGQSTLPEGASVRERINDGLQRYIHGNRIFRGWITDLYFTPERAYGGDLLIAWKPRNRPLPYLAPLQYIFTDTSIQETQVLYTSLDLVRIDQVNDEEKSFLATFFMQVQSGMELDMEQVDFTNAVRNAIDHRPLLEKRLIRSRKDSTGFGFYHYLFKISGKFNFEPDLRAYPLDEQLFPIMLQSANALKPFLIQPSYQVHRDSIFESEGWRYQHQYVGFDLNKISSAGSLNPARRNVPYYKYTFVYVLKRSSIDYFLKTLMPLFSILTIAYFSVYIPPREFEALAAIQVTALLSSIALYFSTFKPQIQYATNSDKIFIFSYVMVTTLIGTSILIYIFYRRNNLIRKTAQFYQRVLFPLIVIGFSIYLRWF